MSEIHSVQTSDGGIITGNTATVEAMEAAFKAPKEPPAPADGAGDGSDGSGAADTPETATEGTETVKRADAKRDMKARMLEATQRESAAKKRADEIEARAARAEAELAEFRQRATADAKRPAESKSREPIGEDPSDPAPKEDDFDTYSAFVTATARWGARQEHAEISKRGQAESRMAQFRDWQIQAVRQFNERVSERAKTEPDLTLPDSVIRLLPQKPFSLDHQMSSDDVIGSYFTNEERGLDLMVYFRDHEDELAKIRTLSPGRVPIELARLEGRLNGAITATPATPQVVRANPPVRPVTAVPPSVDDPNALPDVALSAVEWGKRREALEERRRKAAR